jgi:hypothetical protein
MSSTVRALALAVACLTFAARTAAAQPGAVPAAIRTAAEAISAEQVAWDLAYLSSDELRGRNTPSPGFDMAADYIIERLVRAGLKPGGDAGGFRQHYALHETRVDTNAATIEIAGRRFAFGRDFAMQSLAAPISAELPVVYVGHGWVIPGRKIDAYAGVDVKGKLVLAHGPRALPQGVEVQQLGRVAIDAETPLMAAAARGAAGVLFITQAADLVRWDAIKGASTVRREIEPPVPSAYSAPTMTAVLLTPPVTTALLDGELVTGPQAVRIGEPVAFPASFQLKKTARLHVPVSAATVYRPYNVVAILEGSDPKLKAEAVTVFAHLDGAVGSRNEVFVIGPQALSRQASVLLDRVNESYLKLKYNRQYDTPDSEFFYPRTDAGPFLERGVLTIGFTTGIHNRYHLPADEARALDPVQVHAIARTVLASVWMIGDAAERPGIDQPIPRTVPRHK